MKTSKGLKQELKAAVIMFWDGTRVFSVIDAMGTTILFVHFLNKSRIYVSKPVTGKVNLEPAYNQIVVVGDASYRIGTGYGPDYMPLNVHELGAIDYADPGDMVTIRVDTVRFEEGGKEIEVVRDGVVFLRFLFTGKVLQESSSNAGSYIGLKVYTDAYIDLPFNMSN